MPARTVSLPRRLGRARVRAALRALLACAGLTALAGCPQGAPEQTRAGLVGLGEVVQAGAQRAGEDLRGLGEATRTGVEQTRERLQRAGERVLQARDALVPASTR